MALYVEVSYTISRAIEAGVAIDSGNVIDLLADNFPTKTLPELRRALALSMHSGRWPDAERQRTMTQTQVGG